MPVGLSVDDVVQVTVSLSPVAAGVRNFGAMLIAGPTDVIDVSERVRQYTTLGGVGADFSTTDPEYLAALKWFAQDPQPNLLNIGRWAQANVAAHLYSGGFTAAQQASAISSLAAISAGGFFAIVNGTPQAITGQDFTGVTTMNSIAAVLSTIVALNLGATVWDPVSARLETTSGTVGSLTTYTTLSAPRSKGTITLTGVPSNLDTVTFNGTTVTFVTGTPTGNQVQIVAGNTALNAVALYNFISASTNVQLVKFQYVNPNSGVGIVLYATTPGSGGDSLTLAKSGANITISGATLAGGSAVDVSALLRMTTALGATVVAGLNAETPAAAAAILLGPTVPFLSYGLAFAPTAAGDITDAQYIAVAAFIEANNPPNIGAYTTQETTTLDPSDTTSLAYQLKALGYKRAFTQYSSSSFLAAISAFGRAFTVNFDGNNTTITLMFKQEPGIVAETLTETQAAALKAVNCNVFAKYNNDKSILQHGVMANGFYFDEVQGSDWLQNFVQTAVFNLLYTSLTKIPQTDAGIHTIATTVVQALEQGVTNGLIGPGLTWTGPPVGQIKTGQVLPAGYYVYQPPISSQSASARSAREAPVLQAAVCYAGAVHSSSVLINVVR